MGFKKTNYTIKSNGLTLPEVYAAIRKIDICGTKGVAHIAIQTSRENALDDRLEPLATIKVRFTVKRDENPYTTAYNHAKKEVTVDENGHLRTYKMPFHGWTDDIHTV